jgi:hypothetical protein
MARVAENLEILRAETQMLSIVVTGLLRNATPEAKAYAVNLINEAAKAEPRFALDFQGEELARQGITRLASDWIAVLTL